MNTSVSRTLAFLKPQNPVAMEMIINRIVSAGFRVADQKTMHLTPEMLAEHYAEHIERPFFKPMSAFLMSGPVIVLSLELSDGRDAVQTLRDMVGPTDPKKGHSGLIRHDFGIHDDAIIYMNGIHASGSHEEATEELRRFFG